MGRACQKPGVNTLCLGRDTPIVDALRQPFDSDAHAAMCDEGAIVPFLNAFASEMGGASTPAASRRSP